MEDSGNNLPAKVETGLDIIKQQEADAGLFFLEGLIHKLAPQIAGMNDKISEYLGDNEKIIILRKKDKNSPPVVITFDTAKYLEIVFNKGDVKKLFTAEPEAILNSTDVGQFLQNLLTGGFDK